MAASETVAEVVGRWAYDKTLWPPDHDIWRARMAPNATSLQVQSRANCSLHFHDVEFLPASEEHRAAKEAAANEDAVAGTLAAAEGGRRNFTALDHTFSWGPLVRSSSLLGTIINFVLLINQTLLVRSKPPMASSRVHL